jgi:hypothetical protein
MTRKQAALGAGVAIPLWLVVALAFRDWPAGVFLWPLVFLGGLAAVRLAWSAARPEPPAAVRSGRGGVAGPRTRRHFPVSGVPPRGGREDEANDHHDG